MLKIFKETKKQFQSNLKVAVSAFITTILFAAIAITQMSAEKSYGLEKVSGVYQIESASDLIEFRKLVDKGKEKTFSAKLINDIDLNPNIVLDKDKIKSNSLTDGDGNHIDIEDLNVWVPIGSEQNKFEGVFDGNGHTISGVYFNDAEDDNAGLIGCGNRAAVKNLKIVNSYIKANDFIGAIIAKGDFGIIIENCYSSCVIDGEGEFIAGLIGSAYELEMRGCVNSGEIIGGEAGDFVAGLAGCIDNKLIMTHCRNIGNVTGKGRDVGGLLGFGKDMVIEHCENIGEIFGEGEEVAGLIGGAIGITMKNCVNKGLVVGNKTNIGAFIGYCCEDDLVDISCLINYGDIIEDWKKSNSLIGGVDIQNDLDIDNVYYRDVEEYRIYGTEESVSQEEISEKLKIHESEPIWNFNNGVFDLIFSV